MDLFIDEKDYVEQWFPMGLASVNPQYAKWLI